MFIPKKSGLNIPVPPTCADPAGMRSPDDFEAGIMYVLDTLGIRYEQFQDLLKLKADGSAVIISFTSHKLPEPDLDFVDGGFINGGCGSTTYTESPIFKACYPNGPVSRTSGCSQTTWGSAPMDVPQGPGAGTASSGMTEEREYDYADPWNHPSDGSPKINS